MAGNILFPPLRLANPRNIFVLTVVSKASWKQTSRFLDSPMAIAVTKSTSISECFINTEDSRRVGGQSKKSSLHTFLPVNTLFNLPRQKSMALKSNWVQRHYYLAGSGMCTGWAYSSSLKTYLWKRNAHVIIVAIKQWTPEEAWSTAQQSFAPAVKRFLFGRPSIYTRRVFSAHAGKSQGYWIGSVVLKTASFVVSCAWRK